MLHIHAFIDNSGRILRSKSVKAIKRLLAKLTLTECENAHDIQTFRFF